MVTERARDISAQTVRPSYSGQPVVQPWPIIVLRKYLLFAQCTFQRRTQRAYSLVVRSRYGLQGLDRHFPVHLRYIVGKFLINLRKVFISRHGYSVLAYPLEESRVTAFKLIGIHDTRPSCWHAIFTFKILKITNRRFPLVGR